MTSNRIYPSRLKDADMTSVLSDGYSQFGSEMSLNHDKHKVTRLCKTTSGTNGFLCDDRRTCLTSTHLCNGKVDCSNGEDESNLYCGDLPHSLPKYLVFMCGNQRSWTYIDRKCDGKNHCGDCSDESELQCPSCSGWKCVTVFFSDCDCIPKSRCKDNIQDCSDMSDEKNCTM
ncbi:low-density lipoprotein receptor class A domain-containing protein 1-like isoform X2 [Scyliorhinus torazame]|uniref:low-density lipoprotein receptor class A domain-containing protein 1-like isoform X2 n=1 Tax=Scyliorhinus torazame TaxID=75743 RepID=UPI003B5BE980